MKQLWILIVILWLAFLTFGFKAVPALGPLFEVRRGIWDYHPVELMDQELPGLGAEVTVTFDDYGVPHLFADSENDLYLAQGFVTATQRLFQLDVSTRQTAGRLTEMFGSLAQAYDEFFVRFGMRQSVEASMSSYARDPATIAMLDAYSAGINAYIAQLSELPSEYKILGVRPAPFDAVRVLHMGKALSWSLSGRSFDPLMSRYLRDLGAAKVLDLFPEYLPTKFEDFVFPEHLGHPHPPENAAQFGFQSGLNNIPKFPLPNPGRGSNNWVVAPSKSTSGTSLLANDTHLNLSLPNNWYEIQLSCPAFNVYGVSLVAVPGIVNGFNKDIAWGPTNGTTDVMDFFEVEFADETSLRYKWKDGWEDAKVRTERIQLKPFGSETVNVVETKLGMLLHREGRLGLVADWSGHRPGQELRALRQQYAAHSATECMQNFGRDWSVPIQNFACVDQKNIGWIHAGFVPKRASGEGRFILDGRGDNLGLRTAVEKVPQSLNPAQGYLLSANQKIAPPDYPDYLGWDYEPPFRGQTIRRFLTAKQKLSPQDLMAMQNESLDLQAELILPALLRQLRTEDLPADQKVWIENLGRWDYRMRSATAEPVLFKAWWNILKEEIFGDDLGEGAKILLPKDMRVAWLIERLEKNPADSDAAWVDNKNTPGKIETLPDVVRSAWDKAVMKIRERLGSDPSLWAWKNWNQARFTHVGRLPGFGSEILAMDGGTETIRGQGGQHGAVYKIVVQTGDWPKAWIQVPGGNEGDPFSPRYERFVQEWADGKMRPVAYYHDRAEAVAQAKRVLHLRPTTEDRKGKAGG